MAGQPVELLTGGAGFQSSAQIGVGPNANGIVASASLGAPHVGLVGLVLIAVALLVVLDKAGFRFAVTAGKR